MPRKPPGPRVLLTAFLGGLQLLLASPSSTVRRAASPDYPGSPGQRGQQTALCLQHPALYNSHQPHGAT